eukprot:c32642_g1_i1 orf=3-185(-)
MTILTQSLHRRASLCLAICDLLCQTCLIATCSNISARSQAKAVFINLNCNLIEELKSHGMA